MRSGLGSFYVAASFMIMAPTVRGSCIMSEVKRGFLGIRPFQAQLKETHGSKHPQAKKCFKNPLWPFIWASEAALAAATA